MNIVHLKYAVEVEKTGSITRAAENLFMGQPNLSRSIKDLETSLGIKIFKRTAKAIVPTPQGEEFLTYAKNILAQVEEMEALYNPGAKNKLAFSISVPRVSYITMAFRKLVSTLDRSKEIELNYKETNSMRVLDNIIQNNYNLGIVEYPKDYEYYFDNLFENKSLRTELLASFYPVLVVSVKSPLAIREPISIDELDEYIELCQGDPYVPSLSTTDVKKAEFAKRNSKKILIYERASQIDLLSEEPSTYMWTSAIPEDELEKYGLTIVKVRDASKRLYKDVLVAKKNYRLTAIDKYFLQCVYETGSDLSDQYGDDFIASEPPEPPEVSSDEDEFEENM